MSDKLGISVKCEVFDALTFLNLLHVWDNTFSIKCSVSDKLTLNF